MVAIEPHGPSLRVYWYHKSTKQRQRCVYPTQAVADLAAARVVEQDHRITEEELDEYVLRRPRHTEITPVAPTAPTFAEWAKEWLATKLNIKEKTRVNYRYILKRPLDAFGAVRLPAISNEMVARLFIGASGEIMPRSVFSTFMTLQACLKAAIPRWIAENPCDKKDGFNRRSLPKVRRFEACFLSPEEARLIIDNSPEQIADLVDTLFGTGMRLGEALALRCGRITLGRIPSIYVVDAKSDAGTRTITISRRLAARLAPRIRDRQPSDLAFHDPKGEQWEQTHLRNYYWSRTIAAASRCPNHMPPLRIYKRGRSQLYERLDPLSVSTCTCSTRLRQRPRIHDLRHTHVDWLINEGWDFDLIRERIGHEHVETTIGVYGNRRRRGNPETLEAIDPLG